MSNIFDKMFNKVNAVMRRLVRVCPFLGYCVRI